MMDKDFEMQAEKPGPIVVQRPKIPNDYSRDRLADLLEGDLLSEAQDWYTILKNTGVSNAAAFRIAICNSGAEPHYIKPRAFTAAELQAAIQFFTDKQIPLEHIEMWGKGIDPYLRENDPADLYES